MARNWARVNRGGCLTLSVGISVFVALATVLGSTTAASAAPASGQRVIDSHDGFSIVLPPGWTQVSLNSTDVGAIIGNAGRVVKLNQSLLSEAQNAAKQGIKFFAVSSATENGGTFTPNVNVEVVPETESASLLDAQAKLELTTVGAKGVKTKQIQVATKSALLATYSLPLAQPGAGAVYGAQVYVAHDGKTYIVSFSDATKSGATRSESTMMSSWRYTSN